MPIDRIPGPQNLYLSGAIVAGQPALLAAQGITHIVTTMSHQPEEQAAWTEAEQARVAALPDPKPPVRARLWIDVDDVEEEDMLAHFPRIVRWIDAAFAADPANAVLVHCAMGKSRSATAVIAYLLWKRGSEFGDPALHTKSASEAAVQKALALVRSARAVAEPNDGFMHQLALWWRMGCPADADDCLAHNTTYQHWLYRKDVEESARIGRAPERLWFGDEQGVQHRHADDTPARSSTSTSTSLSPKINLKCKKCRCLLAGSDFIQPHGADANTNTDDALDASLDAKDGCQHYFVEPLSWMRPTLEQGALDGRLVCPNARCGALVGRYSWQGFQCSCRAWVCPAFSLQSARVDKAIARPVPATGPKLS